MGTIRKITAITILLLATSLWAKSGIRFNSYEHDFGSIKQDTVVTATFTFKNTGDSLLVIDRIRTGCGCTSTLLSSKEIQPGGQGTLEISFDSAGYSGRVKRTISVFTNSPANREIKLILIADVIEPGEM